MLPNSLPLYFIDKKDPLKLFLVNDTVILFAEESYESGSVGTAFPFLQDLFFNESTRNAFPKQLQNHFFELESKDLLFPKSVCFCGYPPLVDCRIIDCFAMKLTITHLNEPRIIRLSDFARMEKGSKRLDNRRFGTVDVAKIPGEVFFTAEDAFLFFGNLNVSKTGFLYFAYNSHPFNVPSIREGIDKRFEKFDHNRILLRQYHNSLLNVDYLSYLSQQLSSGAISPERILFLNGVSSLVNLATHPVVSDYIISLIQQLQDESLSLPKMHKLLYFALLTLCHFQFEETLPLVEDFFAKNESLLEQLKKDVRASVPKLSWETKYWDDVKAFYLE